MMRGDGWDRYIEEELERRRIEQAARRNKLLSTLNLLKIKYKLPDAFIVELLVKFNLTLKDIS
jgi:hypothetical protein